MALLQLDPPLPVKTPKGKALAHVLIDYGVDYDLQWVCFQEETGECWTWGNKHVRAVENATMDRHDRPTGKCLDDLIKNTLLTFHKDVGEGIKGPISSASKAPDQKDPAPPQPEPQPFSQGPFCAPASAGTQSQPVKELWQLPHRGPVPSFDVQTFLRAQAKGQTDSFPLSPASGYEVLLSSLHQQIEKAGQPWRNLRPDAAAPDKP